VVSSSGQSASVGMPQPSTPRARDREGERRVGETRETLLELERGRDRGRGGERALRNTVFEREAAKRVEGGREGRGGRVELRKGRKTGGERGGR
jgi:hypothetical protein